MTQLRTLLGILLVSSLPAGALAQEPQLIKRCLTHIQDFETEKLHTIDFKIFRDGSQTFATVAQGDTGAISREKVTILENKVRADLSDELLENDEQLSKLNPGETLIIHAMTLVNDPDFGGRYSVGFDLKKVRSIQAYQIGESTDMGSTTVVEARDADGKPLGSFLGGFLVSRCQ